MARNQRAVVDLHPHQPVIRQNLGIHRHAQPDPGAHHGGNRSPRPHGKDRLKKSIREDVKNDDKDYFAVEMETGGMALAARRAREHFKDTLTEVIAVRGVSDLCNKKSDDVFRELAADHAAAFLTGFLKAGYDSAF